MRFVHSSTTHVFLLLLQVGTFKLLSQAPGYCCCEAFTGSSAVVSSTRRSPPSLMYSESENDRCIHQLSTQRQTQNINRSCVGGGALFSSFYGKFEDFENNDDDDEEEDDEEDEYEELDQRSIADFKSKMSNIFDSEQEGSATTTSVDDLINFARSQQGDKEGEQDWAMPAEIPLQPGTVLVANPRQFCETSKEAKEGGNLNLFRMAMGGGGDGSSSQSLNPSLLAKFGLTRPPPKSLGPDRQADLLPVVVIVEVDERSGVNGVLLNRRTGYLLGDLEQPPPENSEGDPSKMPPILEKFCIQPLWFGGVDNISTGLDMLHLCPTVKDACQITEDGMFWGGDPAQAQDAMEDPSLDRIYSGFDFKFFVQSTIWSTKALRKELDDQVWFPAKVSKNVLFKSRDRMGTKKAKPLWTEIMELMGGRYLEVKNTFYAEGENYSEQDDDM
ncbi:ACR COG1678 domain containing protein [Nitzschia inconspicua]|uniref:ACR COG1678 domain containing protein n=1 Tax=Nitzschia inconspicua TaxID=303405 RepID=A0A9K3PPI6_9STRA|nr:ACR COG1678 domain containing protein [Nitzschia inconspicua]